MLFFTLEYAFEPPDRAESLCSSVSQGGFAHTGVTAFNVSYTFDVTLSLKLCVTVNASLPTPVRPSALVTTTSNPDVTAVVETVMLAVNCEELLKAVEFTVTPPGLVVPLTNHLALAPFLKPLPLTATFRFVVPWGAVFGLVEFTWICAVANAAVASRQAHKRPQNRSDWFFIVFLP